MDTLTDLLDGVHARAALVHRSIMTSPWSLRFASGAPLTLLTMLDGQGWIIPADGDALAIGPGDIAVVRGPASYTVAEDPATPPQHAITSASYCAATARTIGNGGAVPAPRTCGVSESGSAVLLSGAYQGRAGISDRLLDALPDVLVVTDDECCFPLLGAVTAEVVRDRPGQQAVLNRLLDLMLVTTLRAWFDRPQRHAPVWYRVKDDSVVGAALRLMHGDPAFPWTVESLAVKVGVSRAALARRFTAEVGEPPITYLSNWRIALAADLLRNTDATVGSIAHKVGYSGAFALSVAFKRRLGATPSRYRATALPDRRGR
ncbi:AraC family transcriptional regulator [Streptosporangium sandarakinum]|uniref:AraC family transcriptional regulator n=1 Tax=Streptosporangium sandarakinum TaxID=1260955 RepID=UPI00343E6965